MSTRRTQTAVTPKSKNTSHRSLQSDNMSQKMAASTAVPPLPKLDLSIMRPLTKNSPQLWASSNKAIEHLTRVSDAEDLYQWSRQLSASIPQGILKKARKAVGAGADSQEFRNFVQDHHISSTREEIDQDMYSRSESQGSDHCIQFTLPPVDLQPSIGRGYGGNEQDSQHVDDDQEGSEAESEDNEDDEVVIITGDEDTTSSWTFPDHEHDEKIASSAPSIDNEHAEQSAQAETSELPKESIAEEASTTADQELADHQQLDLDYKLPDSERSEITFNEKLLELDTSTGLYHSRVPDEIDFTYNPIGVTSEIAFTLNDSGSIANARSFCETSPNAHETLSSTLHGRLLIVVKYHKPSTFFPHCPTGLAFAETSACTLGDIVEIALAMRLGAGKWKAKALKYEWTEAMVKKAREEGMVHLLGSVVYSRWAEPDPEEEDALDDLFAEKNGDAKQLREAFKSQEKTAEVEQGEVAKDGAEQTAGELAGGQSLVAEVQDTDLEQDAPLQDTASEVKMMLLAGVLGLLVTAYMILYC